MKWCLMFPNVNHSSHLCCQSIIKFINISFPFDSNPHLPAPNAPKYKYVRSFLNTHPKHSHSLLPINTISHKTHIFRSKSNIKVSMSFCGHLHPTSHNHTHAQMLNQSNAHTHSFAYSKKKRKCRPNKKACKCSSFQKCTVYLKSANERVQMNLCCWLNPLIVSTRHLSPHPDMSQLI
jgi:hypothetical protein